MGVLLCSSSNDEGPGQVWMTLLKQDSPSSPVSHNLHCFIDAISPIAPTTGSSIRQPHGNSRCQSELRYNHSPLISVPSMLTWLPHIHLPIIQGSLYSIHPPKPRPPSSTSPISFRIHYLFSSRSLSILSTWPNHLKTFISTLAANSLLTPVLALSTSFLTLSNQDTPVVLLRHFISSLLYTK